MTTHFLRLVDETGKGFEVRMSTLSRRELFEATGALLNTLRARGLVIDLPPSPDPMATFRVVEAKL